MPPIVNATRPVLRAVCGAALALLLHVAAAQEAGDVPREGHRDPRRQEVAALAGTYVAGRETVVLRWADGTGLVLELDRITVPVDGRWHETVATFAVRHRASWLAARGVLAVEEQHNEGAHWRYELRRDATGERLLKVEPPAAPDGDETIVRIYRRRR
ncbi:MAG: hypothetical protein D6696_18245 [Acidobacteria bacterium]|nr:MAG: hypothetical protein D6696_18245 [Acidobacteriota bacterium]